METAQSDLYKNDADKSDSSRLEEAKSIISKLKEPFPLTMNLKRPKGSSPIPARAMGLAVVLRCRMADISEAAHQMFVAQRIVPASVLARAAFETAALMLYAANQVKQAVDSKTVGDTGENLMKALWGQKDMSFKLGSVPFVALNAITTVEKFEKECPGAAEFYANLCEVAHPNLVGTHMSYAKTNRECDLNVDARHGEKTAVLVIPAFQMALLVFQVKYDVMYHAMPEFLKLCDDTFDPNVPDHKRSKPAG